MNSLGNNSSAEHIFIEAKFSNSPVKLVLTNVVVKRYFFPHAVFSVPYCEGLTTTPCASSKEL